MNPEIFTTYIGQDQKANYRLIIPIVNNNDTCRLEIKDGNNVVISCEQNEENEYNLKRSDPVGEYHFTISLYDTGSENTEKLYCQQEITINVLSSQEEFESKQNEKTCQMVLDFIKQINVETGAGMGGAWITANNIPAVWRKLNRQLHGEEVNFLCDILEESYDFKIYWVALNFLNYSYQDITDNKLLTRILNVASEHITSGGHVQSIALQLIQKLDLPSTEIWKALLSALRIANPSYTREIVRIITNYVPAEGKKATANAILRIIKSLPVSAYEIVELLGTIESIDYRDDIISLRNIMIRPGNPQVSDKIANILFAWGDSEAAATIHKYLDASHALAGNLAILNTMRILYRLEGKACLQYLAQLLPKCPDFVKQNIGNDWLGELRYEPEIISAAKEILTTTNNQDVKKTLTDFIEKFNKK
jgi:hypothetical protein